ncbi:AAA family ATPase [Pseudomonas sp. DNDY-54]|uniref:AAA family ATPase n=1 Tax=Pseudomonas sp. DNDY-54 TaxID=2870860 RepID=UPI001CA432E2|nr:AAA family ATPase [Pseudomonas sp. DNDY-54]
MDGYIEKIEKIKNIAVFKDFSWNDVVRDGGNNIAEFKKINIIYGRNYTGKTTLSRIVRSLETGLLSEKYPWPLYNVKFNKCPSVTQNNPLDHGQVIRVFNEDFVRENLKFIVDYSKSINSFAILGEDNAKIESEIADLELTLGSADNPASLVGKALKAELDHTKAVRDFGSKLETLEAKLKDKSNKPGLGIKHNKFFGDANYNVGKIREDIKVVGSENYSPISQEKIGSHHKLLREDLKAEIRSLPRFELQYTSIATAAKQLLEREIKASAPLADLLSDAVLEVWVREGRDLHQDKRNTCGFCGGALPQELWEKLDKHFNQESEELREAINKLLAKIANEKQRAPSLLRVRTSDFYTAFHGELDKLQEDFERYSQEYIEALAEVEKLLVSRLADIYTKISFSHDLKPSNLSAVYWSYETLAERSNAFAKALSNEQANARSELRLHEVYTFTKDIKYSEECKEIDALRDATAIALASKESAIAERDLIVGQVKKLKAELKDESKGAEKVNNYLNDFFGHNSLTLEAVEQRFNESATHRFEVIRNKERAFHLSEGECSLIAFCYFMAKLDDYETRGSQPIIWIDDPICSLDSNHIFFIYSLIHSDIASPEKYLHGDEVKQRDKFKQLFISTHNLDFLKYLKRLPGAGGKKLVSILLLIGLGKRVD